MLKKLHNILNLGMALLIFTATAALCSCSDDLDAPENPNKGLVGETNYLKIAVKCSKNGSRAAEEPGIDDLNENKIKNVVVCLSPTAGDRTDNDLPSYMHNFTDLDSNGEVVLRIPLTVELINRLFSENGTSSCQAFVAVNVNPGNANTVAQLREMAITSTFDNNQVQTSFTMDGDASITYNEVGNYAIGEINVKRSAAKITLALDVDKEVEETINGTTLTWISRPAGMSVKLLRGVKNSNLDPRPTPNMDQSVYFNSSDALRYTFQKVTRPEGDYYARYDQEQTIPFYTYPNQWTDSPDEQQATFMMLSVPWSSDGGQTWRTCYYHVPVVKPGLFETVRNTSYHINLHVGVLGSFVPEEPMELNADYYIAEWGTESLDVDIKDSRYLVVDQNIFEVNNERTISIPFYTSHPCSVISSKMTFYRYNFSDQGSEFAVTVSENLNKASKDKFKEPVYTVEFINDKNSRLQIDHDLVCWQPYKGDNPVLLTRNASGVRESIDKPDAIAAMLNTIQYFKRTDDAEYSAVKFEVTVQHTDIHNGETNYPTETYKETITVWQYPGMYITAKQNYCENLAKKEPANAFLGNTIINGRTDGKGVETYASAWGNEHRIAYNYQNWDYSIGLGFPPDYLNWNPNLYLVTITQLSPELGKYYNIGDPRSNNININLANNSDDYTVDGGSDKIFTTEYWYYQINSNQGPETSSSWQTLFKGQYNPLDFQVNVNKKSWDEIIINGFKEAQALDLPSGQKRLLKYYYPTREADDNMYTIAPKFRICSSYAGSSAYMTREMSRRRAAAYQELGFCAGRWRVPTYGEVEYIMKLAAEEKIPRLFGRESGATWCYWCAQGAVLVPAGNAANKNPSLTLEPDNVPFAAVEPFTGDDYKARVRFVYDEWYWGNDTLVPNSNTPSKTETIYDFTWGDKERTPSQIALSKNKKRK